MCWSEAIGVAATIAGPIIGGSQQKQVYEAEADAAEADAEDEAEAAYLRKIDRQERQAAKIAEARARAGAAGFDPNVGSPADTTRNTAREFAKEQFLDDFETDRRIRSLLRSAGNYKQSGQNQLIGGFLDAGANVGSWLIKG